MSIKEKYIQLRDEVRNFLKDQSAVLENHEVVDSNIYRLHYISFDKDSKGVRSTQYIGKPFAMRYRMSREELFDIVSYLFTFVKNMTGIRSTSFTGTRLVNDVIKNYPQYGLERLEEADEDRIVDLYVIDGNAKTFKKTRYYERFINWYNPDVSFDNVSQIIEKYERTLAK